MNTPPMNADDAEFVALMDRRDAEPIFTALCFDRWQAELAAGEGVE